MKSEAYQIIVQEIKNRFNITTAKNDNFWKCHLEAQFKLSFTIWKVMFCYWDIKFFKILNHSINIKICDVMVSIENSFKSIFWIVNQWWNLANQYVVRCAIWCHLYNLKTMKNTHKLTLLHGCFSRFLNCTNGTKSHNASHIVMDNIFRKYFAWFGGLSPKFRPF